jgi:hypothetical protein
MIFSTPRVTQLGEGKGFHQEYDFSAITLLIAHIIRKYRENQFKVPSIDLGLEFLTSSADWF